MQRAELQQYMHQRIPISKAMGVEVAQASAEAVTLSAPLAPNINHRDTVFGGSASAVALLAAWALLLLRLKHDGLDGYIVVRRNTMSYDRPMTGDFTATAALADTAAWTSFTTMLQRKQRARLSLTVALHCRGEKAGELQGEFVVMASETSPDTTA